MIGSFLTQRILIYLCDIFRRLFLFTRVRTIYHIFPLLFPLFSHAKRSSTYRTCLGLSELSSIVDFHMSDNRENSKNSRKKSRKSGFLLILSLLPSQSLPPSSAYHCHRRGVARSHRLYPSPRSLDRRYYACHRGTMHPPSSR